MLEAAKAPCILWRQILEINTKVRLSAKGQWVHYSITGREGSRLQGKKFEMINRGQIIDFDGLETRYQPYIWPSVYAKVGIYV